MPGKIFAYLLFALLSLPGLAQKYTIDGVMADSATKSALIGVNVVLTSTQDSTAKYYAATGIEGDFRLQNVPSGTYNMEVSYVGYNHLYKRVRVDGNVSLGKLLMSEAQLVTGNVEITAKIPPVQQKGDTTEYNASAYKTNPDATAEDLVTKMPGVTVENGTVKAQGEDVKKVLVDGKEFFGDDASLALKNLPADMVDKVQVYDRMSDQAGFTGIDDGNSAKTINIVTKKDRREGFFGKVYGGYGTDDRYNTGGTFNWMKNNTRITLLGMSNNINQQNFSMQDILGATGGGGGGFRGGRGGPANNFMVGQQNGISTTSSLGFNLATTIGSKINLTGSYFFNRSDNDASRSLRRNFFINADSSQLYSENSSTNSSNLNHRINLRFEYAIDSLNSLIITPSIRFQDNSSISRLNGSSTVQGEQTLNSLSNTNTSDNNGYTLNNDMLYRHKFKKDGRTFSINVSTGLNNKINNTSLKSVNSYFTGTNSFDSTVNQHSDILTSGYTLGTRVNYTEPISKKSLLQFSYRFSKTYSESDKKTNDYNPATQNFDDLDTLLSNAYNNTYTTQSGGLDYVFKNAKANLTVGADAQMAVLDGNRFFPTSTTIKRTFYNILPSAMYTYKFTEKSNLRIRYRASTNAPNVNQLQNVVNNTNPLQLSTGNEKLVQDYTNMLFSRYMISNTEKASSMFAMLIVSNTQNYIGNATFIAAHDTTVNNVFLNRGSQLTYPVNLDGYWNTRAFFTYSRPAKFIKSNFSTNTGVTYSRTPGLINNRKNLANTINFSEGVVISSNVSKNLDFTLGYTANYNIVANSIRPDLNNNYFFHSTNVKFNWIFWEGLFAQTDATQTLYRGLSSSFNQSFLLWNAAIGKKFLKNQSGELKLSVFDILNQNNSIGRTVTETYIEDTQTKVLNRYFMLTFTYTFRKFKKGGDQKEEEQPMPNRPPGGGPFPH